MVDLPSSPLAEIDAEFERVALETGGLTFAQTATSAREKLLQVTAHDVCLANLGLAYRMHVLAGGANGIGYADQLALIRFVAPYAGYPAAASAMLALRQHTEQLGRETPNDLEAETVEPEHTPNWPIADAWLAEFVDSRLRRAWAEARLSVRERAFVALTALITLGELGEPFDRHLDLALQVADQAAVRSAVRFTAELGVTRAGNALQRLDRYLSESRR
ncbi:hypothetical protein [Microlunatus sp. GCM10028923]|uniref:hypothetical protein n=1 Tax=Microlunatus sp. GCM10028923 TaxID=3273400 RepID=UPI00360715B0